MTFKEFTIEGEAVLGYVSDEPGRKDRHVSIKDENNPEGLGLEQIIAKSLGFPNDSEFETMSNRLANLREQGTQPLDGEPDISRTGFRLKIQVSIVEDGE